VHFAFSVKKANIFLEMAIKMKKKNLIKETNKIFWKFVLVYKWQGFLTFGAIGVATVLEIIEPLYFKKLFDSIEAKTADLPYLFSLFSTIVLVAVGYWFFWRVATYANVYFQTNVKQALYQYCFEKLHLHSVGFFADNFAGSLTRKVNKYDRAFETVADEIAWGFYTAGIRIVVVVGILLYYYPTIAFILIGWLCIYITFQVLFSKYKLRYDRVRSELETKSTGYLADTIANNFNLKVFASYKREVAGFANLLKDWRTAFIKSWNLSVLAEAIQGALMISLRMTFLGLSVYFWHKGRFSAGDIVLIYQYTNIVFSRLWDMGRNIRRTYEAYADAVEMTEILTTPYEVADKGTKQLKVTEGKIVFDKVSFAYPNGQEIFKDFSLTIKPGEKIALVGTSGAGKSTLTKLLLRFTNLTSGAILVDGEDISKVTQDSLRKMIGYVPQEPVLFHRTLMENIRYGKPNATEAEVIAAAKKAHCHEFITSFSEGYDTYVGERGVKLSGGERQRVAIARAMLKDAPVLILDEATSSLDSESEKYIQEALHELFQHKTVLVIAHRLSTVMEMDRIVVLEEGGIVEEGTHQELLEKQNGIYKKLWNIQSGNYL